MRMLKLFTGIAVLLATIHLMYSLHHFYTQASRQDVQSPFFWAGMVLAAIVGILSFIGGGLLLMRRS